MEWTSVFRADISHRLSIDDRWQTAIVAVLDQTKCFHVHLRIGGKFFGQKWIFTEFANFNIFAGLPREGNLSSLPWNWGRTFKAPFGTFLGPFFGSKSWEVRFDLPPSISFCLSIYSKNTGQASHKNVGILFKIGNDFCGQKWSLNFMIIFNYLTTIMLELFTKLA